MATLEDRKTVLLKSPIWNYLLLDKEIRYSDFLLYFLTKYNYNPFGNESMEGCKVYREMHQADLWINKVHGSKSRIVEADTSEQQQSAVTVNQEFEKPYFLIENKLKSIPYKDQLERYTKSFLKEYGIWVKQKVKKDLRLSSIRKDKLYDIGKRLLENAAENSFYLLSLTGEEEYLVDVKISTVVDWYTNEDKKLTFKWHHFSYSSLGAKILKKAKQQSTDYTDRLFEDFANVLLSFKIFEDEIKCFEDNDKISCVNNPIGVFYEFKRMHDLYKKIRVSQCAEKLQYEINKQKENKENQKAKSIIQSWSFKSFKELLKEYDGEYNTPIIVNYGFTNKSGLFEAARLIVKDKLTYVLQFQKDVVKKAIVVKSDKIDKYIDWFKATETMGNISFDHKKEKEEFNTYALNYGYTFYYTSYHVGAYDTIQKIVDFIANNICDENTFNELSKICQSYS